MGFLDQRSLGGIHVAQTFLVLFGIDSYDIYCLQSLLVIFARLMHDQMEAVLEFLTSVPDPMGKPALEFVLKEWCARQHLFYGAYERKVM